MKIKDAKDAITLVYIVAAAIGVSIVVVFIWGPPSWVMPTILCAAVPLKYAIGGFDDPGLDDNKDFKSKHFIGPVVVPLVAAIVVAFSGIYFDPPGWFFLLMVIVAFGGGASGVEISKAEEKSEPPSVKS